MKFAERLNEDSQAAVIIILPVDEPSDVRRHLGGIDSCLEVQDQSFERLPSRLRKGLLRIAEPQVEAEFKIARRACVRPQAIDVFDLLSRRINLPGECERIDVS